jgi:hypothetical protein
MRPENLALMVGRGRTPELAHLLMCQPLRADLFGVGILWDEAGNDMYLGSTDKDPGRPGEQPGRAGTGDGHTWATPRDKEALGSFVFGYGFDR